MLPVPVPQIKSVKFKFYIPPVLLCLKFLSLYHHFITLLVLKLIN